MDILYNRFKQAQSSTHYPVYTYLHFVFFLLCFMLSCVEVHSAGREHLLDVLLDILQEAARQS